MNYKRLIPCIFIYQGKAVKWFDNLEILSDDVVKLAKKYNDMGADELLVFDLSTTDEEHDHAIDLMKKINRVIRIPMVAGGNIRRQEDVKKILYTGAKRAIFPSTLATASPTPTGPFCRIIFVSSFTLSPGTIFPLNLHF